MRADEARTARDEVDSTVGQVTLLALPQPGLGHCPCQTSHSGSSSLEYAAIAS
jgi:hypothetical protein